MPWVLTVLPSTSVNLKRRVRKVIGPWSFTKWPSSVRVDITKPRPALMMHLQIMSLPKGPLISAAVAKVLQRRNSSL